MVDLATTRSTLAVAGVLSAAAVVRVGLLPMSVPLPKAANPELRRQLERAGWVLTQTSQPTQGRQVSKAQGYLFTLQGSQPEIQLSIVPVRTRGSNSLSVKKILETSEREEIDSSKSIYRSNDTLQMNKTQDGQLAVTTCIISSKAASEAEQLVKLRLSQDPHNTMTDRLMIFAGLQQPRAWNCLFTQLSTSENESAQTKLLTAWDSIQAILKHPRNAP